MKYVTHRRFKKLAICGEVNIPALSECESIDGMIYFNGLPICTTTSENAHTFFAINEDGCGMRRGKLTRQITNKLQKKDDKYQERWNRVWNDSLCQKYKRREHEDHWLWNHAFYIARIEDLEYIANLISINN